MCTMLSLYANVNLLQVHMFHVYRVCFVAFWLVSVACKVTRQNGEKKGEREGGREKWKRAHHSNNGWKLVGWLETLKWSVFEKVYVCAHFLIVNAKVFFLPFVLWNKTATCTKRAHGKHDNGQRYKIWAKEKRDALKDWFLWKQLMFVHVNWWTRQCSHAWHTIKVQPGKH